MCRAFPSATCRERQLGPAYIYRAIGTPLLNSRLFALVSRLFVCRSRSAIFLRCFFVFVSGESSSALKAAMVSFFSRSFSVRHAEDKLGVVATTLCLFLFFVSFFFVGRVLVCTRPPLIGVPPTLSVCAVRLSDGMGRPLGNDLRNGGSSLPLVTLHRRAGFGPGGSGRRSSGRTASLETWESYCPVRSSAMTLNGRPFLVCI